MPPTRFRNGRTNTQLHPSSEVTRFETLEAATQFLEAGVEQNGIAYVADLLTSLDDPNATNDDADAMVEALAHHLVAGAFMRVLVETLPRTLDEPQAVDLASLADPSAFDGGNLVEPDRPGVDPDTWIGLEVIDQRGNPLPFFTVQLEDPTGKRHTASLATGAKTRFDDLGDEGTCTITLVPRDPEG